jgi:hypothetical protein
MENSDYWKNQYNFEKSEKKFLIFLLGGMCLFVAIMNLLISISSARKDSEILKLKKQIVSNAWDQEWAKKLIAEDYSNDK